MCGEAPKPQFSLWKVNPKLKKFSGAPASPAKASPRLRRRRFTAHTIPTHTLASRLILKAGCKVKRSMTQGAVPKYCCKDCGGTRRAGDFGLMWCRCKQRWFTRCSSCYREIKPMGKDEEENFAIALVAKELGE